MDILKVENLTKIYGKGENSFKALDNVSFSVKRGQFVAIVGPSGSGKSTLLHLIGGVDRPDGGHVYVDGNDVYARNDTQLAIFRRREVGLIYQFYNLIPSLTSYENIALVKSIVKGARDADELLKLVGLSECRNKFPAQMSGGEQQRVSIARALAKNPKILLGDEPTGALDSETGVIVLELLQKLCKEEKRTVILVTHNADIAKCADKVIRMKNGKIREIYRNEKPLSVKEVEW